MPSDMSPILWLSLIALIAAPGMTVILAQVPFVRRQTETVLMVIALGFAIYAVWEAAYHAGMLVLLAAGTGFAGMLLVEHIKHDVAARAHQVGLLFLLAVLSFHALLDGAGLALVGTETQMSHGHSLGWALVVHRLPAGMAVWWLLRRDFTASVAVLGIGLMIVATLLGYGMSQPVVRLLDPLVMGLAQAFAAGVLGHIVLHPLREHRH